MAAQKIGGRFIHLPDIHMNTDLLDAVADLMDTRTAANNNIHYDAIFSPGDFIDTHEMNPHILGEDTFKEYMKRLVPRINKIGKNLEKKGIINEKGQFLKQDTVGKDPEATEFYKVLVRKHFSKGLIDEMVSEGEITLDNLIQTIDQSYQTVKPSLEKLANKAPMLAVLGNHDSKAGYRILSDKHGGPIQFVEYDTPGINIQGKNGLEWFIQGSNNTYERTTILEALAGMLSSEGKENEIINHHIDYNEGYSLAEAQKNPNPDVARSIQFSQLSQRTRLDNTVRDAQGNPKAPDLYLTHKATKDGYFGTGDIAAEYGAKSRGVLSGHHHMPQIGNLHGNQIADAINTSTETTTIDGFDEEVKVFYFDNDNGIPQLNAGSNLVYEVIYDDDKKFKEVIIYQAELIQKAA